MVQHELRRLDWVVELADFAAGKNDPGRFGMLEVKSEIGTGSVVPHGAGAGSKIKIGLRVHLRECLVVNDESVFKVWKFGFLLILILILKQDI